MKTLEDIPEKERAQIKELITQEAPDFYEALLFELMCLAHWNEVEKTSSEPKLSFYSLHPESKTTIRMTVMETIQETRHGMISGITTALIEDYFNASETPNPQPPSKGNGHS